MLIASSDYEQDFEVYSSVNKKSLASSDPTSDIQNVSQQAVNVQILGQLQAMGKPLDAMEAKSCKKSTDSVKNKNKHVKSKSKTNAPVTLPPGHQGSSHIPDLHSISQDAVLQAQVAKCLKELTDSEKLGTKLKPWEGEGGTVEVMVANSIKWPYEYVLSGVAKEPITYDQLSVTQWVAGFGRIMKEEKNQEIKEHTLDYLVALFDYTMTFLSSKPATTFCSSEWNRER